MPLNPATEKYEVVAGGGTKNFASDTQTESYVIWSAGGVALVGNVTITDDGSSTEGMEYPVLFTGGVTLNAHTLTIFGYSLSQAQATNGCKILAYFDGSTFIPFVDANANGTGQIGADDIADEAVTLGKMADLARGSLIVGGASNRPVALDVKTSGAIPIGDGTDVAAHTITGDITMNSGGVSAIGATKVTNGMLAGSIAYNKLAAMATGSFLAGNAGVPTVSVMSGDAAVAAGGAVTIANNSVTPEKSTSNLTDQTEPIVINLAIPAGKYSIKMGDNFSLRSVSGINNVAIVANCNITMDINGVPVTGGTTSWTAADPINTPKAGTAITANNTGAAGATVNFIVTTAGGETSFVNLSLVYRKTS